MLNDENGVRDLKELAEMFHSHDCKVFAQILHPGRQGQPIFNNNDTPIAPSAIPEGPGYPTPRELSTEEVQLIISRFIRSAELALSAGVDGIEIHAAHGYLPYQFMAARANKRTDQYGGSFENRMRFISEIAEGVNKCLQLQGLCRLPDEREVHPRMRQQEAAGRAQQGHLCLQTLCPPAGSHGRTDQYS